MASVAWFIAAASETSRPVRRRPFSRRISPCRKSRPATRTFLPRGAGIFTTTISPSRPVFSWITTVSLPGGHTPPVKIRAAAPLPTRPAKGRPAATSPISFRRAGTVATSSPRTAYPSMAETSSGGWVRRAARSSASTRPSASASGTHSIGNGSTPSSTRASALGTGSSAISRSLAAIRFGAVDARLAAPLLDEANAFDAHAALDRLHHVVDGEAGDRDGGKRLHLDAGLAFQLGGRPHDHAGQLLVRSDIHLDLGQRKRMAERDQLVRLLRRHDAGDARGAQHVALLGVALEDKVESLARHHHAAFRDCDPFGCGFVGHIDHAGFAALADVGELRHALLATLRLTSSEGDARAALWSRRKHLSAASGFRRSGTWRRQPFQGGRGRPE